MMMSAPFPRKRSPPAGDGRDPGQYPGLDPSSSNLYNNNSRVKLPRIERNTSNTDFSAPVKRRLSAYTRTGQACDRCKVRKIRCDAAPEGCTHCLSQGLECFVTDRVTGRTERRGYIQELEQEKGDLKSRIRDLEVLLGLKGVKVEPLESSGSLEASADDSQHSSGTQPEAGRRDSWDQMGSVRFKDDSLKSALPPKFQRTLLVSRPREVHIGVGGDDAPFSSIKGLKLSIFGETIDFTSFAASDMDELPANAEASTPLYNKSTRAFLQSTMGINPPPDVELPADFETAFRWSSWFFDTIANFLPVLHRPTFESTLTKMYDGSSFVPSVAELVQIHMVYAIIYYQFGVRNWSIPDDRANLNEKSNKHYHFALSKLFELTSSGDLPAVQAMAMICAHTRAFPKPNCASIVVSQTFQRALDLGLHRESKKQDETTNLNHEMRKRTWWVILTVYIAVSGRRGLPMPIMVEEFDVGFPEPVADELLSGDGMDTSRTLPCPYEVGICSFKIVPIMMEMWTNIYSVRRDAANYVNIVKTLEGQGTRWFDELPNHLKLGHDEQKQQDVMLALFLRSFLLEFRLCLRHPSVAITTDKDMIGENLRVCEEVTKEMLTCQLAIQKLKCLDTTWYQISIHAACIFTTLYAHWEKRHRITPDEFDQLKTDMRLWVGIIEETGSILGSGPQISSEIWKIINRTMGMIEQDTPKKNETSEPPRATPALKQFYQEPSLNDPAAYPTLPYKEQPQNNMNQPFYRTDATMFFNPSAQAAATTAAAVATDVPGASAARLNSLINFGSQPPQGMTGQMWNSGPWQNFTAAAMCSTQDRLGPTSLPNLGAHPRPSNAPNLPEPAPGLSNTDMWPMTLFESDASNPT
ncbi:hypothetical protein B0T10DRAFT_136224 [Thelonectria olida]|uniref:Zn(2)-C6 fungal-type domain-containing protein n=1 Tax=Thelonectria olida TaxID=1576542 RepID=A0A9P9AL97_9HYPO|nr:hypothetical protein B0T10DRAFT_136224 [Thelonectria olida]